MLPVMLDTPDPSPLLRHVIDNWRHVPLHLRQQYWRETDYGARLPAFELLVAMDAAIVAVKTAEPHD